MALFGTKKNTEKTAKKAAAPATVAGVTQGSRSLAHVLRHARITEKATMNQAAGVYTFDVAPSATKREIMQAVKELYGVTPRKVAVINVPSKIKQSMRTGMRGVKRGGKKAYVYLKSGESITIS
jgi:large subunit ribosomal protein L23